MRAFQAAYTLGIATVAMYPYEDRNFAPPAEGRGVVSDRREGPVRVYQSVDKASGMVPITASSTT